MSKINYKDAYESALIANKMLNKEINKLKNYKSDDNYMKALEQFHKEYKTRIDNLSGKINRTVDFLKRIRRTYEKSDITYEVLSVAIINLTGFDEYIG